MSLWNSFAADTAGFVYRSLSGNLDPWTVKNLKQQAAADLTKAAGPNADPTVLAANIAAGNAQIDGIIAANGATPGQCFFRIPIFGCITGPDSQEGLNRLKLGVDILLLVIVAGVTYVVLKKVGLWGDLVKAFK
jgi:hypothetical protein